MSRQRNYISDFPELLTIWDYDRNSKLGYYPQNITSQSGKKVWWKCANGHSYQSVVAKKTSLFRNCPYCTNRKVLSGYNDLETKYPNVASEWHPSKNGTLLPNAVLPHAKRKVWWQCSKCGWEWEAVIYSRTANNGNGTKCPHCSSNKTSFPEQAIFYYIKKLFPDAKSRDNTNGFELDIYIPSKKVGIEYDGRKYHSHSVTKDNKKDLMCKTKGITLIRIREKDLPATNIAHIITRNDSNSKSLNVAIIEIFKIVGVSDIPDIDIDNDQESIYKQYYESETDGSVSNLFPNLIIEWHPTKNGNLTPDRCKARSGRKVWWLCQKCGGEYRAIVAQRTQGHSCPYCSGHKALNGISDLQTSNPSLASQWHPTRNGELMPTDVKCQSNIKVWWLCPKCNYEWQASIYSRNNGNGCPSCAGQVLIVGKNDLKTINPKLAKEWHPFKNGLLTPDQVMASSGKKVWWLCPICNFEWQAVVASRNDGRGCNMCGQKKSASSKWKAVIQYSTSNEYMCKYESIKAAKEATGATSIIACCQHKRKTSGGFIWRYAEDEEEK